MLTPLYMSSEHDPTMRAVHVLNFEERCGGKKNIVRDREMRGGDDVEVWRLGGWGGGLRLWRSATLRRTHLNVRQLPQGRGRSSLPMGC